jgi:hypothetical protein
LAVLLGYIEAAQALDVTLAWDPNSESDLAGYKIYYATSSGGPYNGTGSTSGSSPIIVPLNSLVASSPEFTVRDLPNGTYYLVVTAYDTQGVESGYSSQVSASSAATQGPTISSFIVGGQSGASTVYTNSTTRQVSVRIVASDDVALSQYLILDNQSDPTGKTFFNIPGAGQKTADFTISFAINNSDGNRTLYAWVKNAQGVISSAASKPNVVLDRVAPTVALSYSKPNPYKAGDSVTATANFSDANPIAANTKISINYAGTAVDLTGAALTRVSDKQWTYNLTIPPASDGVATVTIAASDMAGNTVGTQTGNTFTVDTAAYSKVPTIVGSPILDYTNLTMTITYSEGGMKNASVSSNYSFNNGLLLAGNGIDVNGNGKTFRFSLNGSTFNKSLIYTMTISGNVTNSVGTSIPSGSRAAQVNDVDNDGMADGWELQCFGSITATNGSADTDHDGWTNLQEYELGTNPNDASSRPTGKPPRVKIRAHQQPLSTVATASALAIEKEVIPRVNEIAANDTGFAVLLESEAGINTSDSSAVTLTIEDGTNTYQRNLLQENATQYTLAQAAPVSANGSVVQAASAVSGSSLVANEVWVVYYRSAETSLSNTWPFGSLVRVSVTAKDVDGNAMQEPEVFTFEVENAASYNERVANRPSSNSFLDQSGAKVVENSGTLATVTFKDNLPITPYFEREKTFDYPEVEAQTRTVTLGPRLVFPDGATVFIPWRKDRMSTSDPMAIFGFDGETWQPIIDGNGNDLTNGSWVVPGWNNGLSWQMVDDDAQSGVRIKVRHFSSFAGASGAIVADIGTSVSGTSVPPSSGGCFITAIMK